MCSNTLLYITSHQHNKSNRIFLAFASIRSKFTIFDSLHSIYMKLRYETNFLRESSNLSSPRFVNIREPCLNAVTYVVGYSYRVRACLAKTAQVTGQALSWSFSRPLTLGWLQRVIQAC